ncbi:MAG TPA: nucleoside triphosphate pyrophosphohydrolase [Candidatus Limnocylindria bacterium]|nr:nucleoside triphosphate pyrophosphohydrolase [Candidatus Limnocylindria bacterium]
MSARPASVDALLAAASIEPGAGVQIVDAARLASVPFDPGLPLLVLRSSGPASSTEPAGVLPGRHVRAGGAALLARLYPPGHRLRHLGADGDGGAEVALERAVDELTDAELAASDWLVPPLSPIDNIASPHGMAAISARLRAPDGCPWDRRQTHATLRPFVLEEAYETVDAIERGTAADLAEELGDLFLQVILHAQLAAEKGTFDLVDVYRTLGAKIVRRHPHVFGDVEAHTAEQVLANWEAIKSEERVDAGRTPSAFEGIARALPALPASREIQERASSMGWDWDAIEGVWEKVDEELAELHAAAGLAGDEGRDERLHELGDLFFAIVNLARWMKLDPEEALRSANRRWIERYARVEELAAERGITLAELDLAGKDRLWDEVKRRAVRA